MVSRVVSSTRSGINLLHSARLVALLALVSGAAPPLHALVISEISYNPGPNGSADDALEFVEVFNDAPTGVDLSGAYFARGIEFVFPEDTFLKARSAIAVCANLEAMKVAFPQANLVGNYAGKLDNGGETLTLVTPSGSPLAEVSYRDRGQWPASADGTGFTLALVSAFADVTDAASWVRSAQKGGTPGSENFAPPQILDTEIFAEIGPGALWRVRKGFNEATQQPEEFSTPSTAWRELSFNDSTWLEGEAPIGYGEPEIVTTLADMDGRYGSFALRKKFTMTQALHDEILSLTLALRVDDSYVAYLNGQEIGRIGFASDPGTEVAFGELANAARELKSTRPLLLNIPRQKVLVGENVLAVQVHNRTLTATTGSDAGFAAALAYQTRVVFAAAPTPTVLINEVVSRAPAAARGIELYNTLGTEMLLDGWSIALGPEKSAVHTLPAGTRMAPHSFLFLPEATLGFLVGGVDFTLLLLEADGITPADAVSLIDPAPLPAGPQSHVRFPDGDPQFWIATEPTAGTANRVAVQRDIVINEIHYNPKLLLPSHELHPNADRGEFIELYNRSAQAIALDGYRLTSGFNFDFAPGTVLAAGAYLVVARDPRRLREAYGLSPDQVLGPPDTASEEDLANFGSLRNRGERIRLVDSLGNTADEVTFRSEGEWDELADGGGSSLELIDPNQDNASPQAWAASDETRRAPWTQINYTARNVTSLVPTPQEAELHVYFLSEGEMLIDGVSVMQGNPATERVPNGDFETDTRGWRLLGTHVRSSRTTEEAKVGAASLRVVATGGGDNRVNRAEIDLNPMITNGDVTVSLWARWVKGSNAIHVSGHNNAFGRTFYLPVPQDAGSPGRENTVRARLRELTGSDNLGPVISRVKHSPAVPLGLAPVHFRAQVTDADGVASVDVLHQKDGAAAFERTKLFDDGQHQDGAAGDGLWGGEIAGYANRTLVNFYLEATDMGRRLRTYPTRAPERTLLFATDDKFDSALWRYRLLVNQKELNTPVTGLARRLLHSDELVRGTFVFEESEVYYDVGVRYRGSPWNRPPDPKMFRVRFNGDKPFVDGVKRINISRYGSVQNEGIAYQLLAKAGREGVTVPHSPRYTYINMKYNTAVHGSGALSEIRPIDGDYMSYNWPNDADGQAWKITGKLAFSDGGTMAGGGPDWTVLRVYGNGPYAGDPNSAENYRFYFNPTVKLDLDEFKPLIELLKTMDRGTTPDATYDEAIQNILNVEASLRVYAIRALLADWDTIDIGNGQNAYLYYAPVEGRHYLVPWDMDHTFERAGEAIVPATSTNGFRRLINRPLFRRQYASILHELNQSSWSEAYLNNWTKLVSETGTPGKVAPATSLVTFLRGRRTMVDTFVRSGINVTFAVTSPNPTGAPSQTVPLQGTAGINVAYIFFQVPGGELTELKPTWSTPPRQTTAIPTIWQGAVTGIAPGKHAVELLAFDRAGNLVASTRTNVYNTTGWEAPTLSSIEPAAGPKAGGTLVTLRGTGFQEGLTVKLGSKLATMVTLVSATEATASTPASDVAGPVDVTVSNIDLLESKSVGAFLYTDGLSFRRGELDGDDRINTTDVVLVLNYLFREGTISCTDAADVNDDGKVNITDPIVLLRHLFQGGEAPPPPFDTAGFDPTADDLGCGG